MASSRGKRARTTGKPRACRSSSSGGGVAASLDRLFDQRGRLPSRPVEWPDPRTRALRQAAMWLLEDRQALDDLMTGLVADASAAELKDIVCMLARDASDRRVRSRLLRGRAGIIERAGIEGLMPPYRCEP